MLVGDVLVFVFLNQGRISSTKLGCPPGVQRKGSPAFAYQLAATRKPRGDDAQGYGGVGWGWTGL